ncbi:DinB family protein [Asticcacaulis sp. BYS171W]|uniref:DinB family protein n=1 Tax=Asticcacaulis aquaticus TaxID=2984212 RepID=A0ABT5HYF9_9CAUL|nr:DinB family protein [Asticcacaulis aquaticus]
MTPLGYKAHLALMARYNQWMNGKVLTLMADHPERDFTENRGGFFKSVWGALNHLIVADIIWLARMTKHPSGHLLLPVLDLPKPAGLTDILYEDYQSYAAPRRALDELLIAYVDSLNEDDIASTFTYSRANGETHTKVLGLTLSHVFNHQTHHRGQITTLFTQMGLDIGVTDVHLLVPELTPEP